MRRCAEARQLALLSAQTAEGGRLFARRLSLGERAIVVNGSTADRAIEVLSDGDDPSGVYATLHESGGKAATVRLRGSMRPDERAVLKGERYLVLHVARMPPGVTAANSVVGGEYVLTLRNDTGTPIKMDGYTLEVLPI
jgi:hypothetical protein